MRRIATPCGSQKEGGPMGVDMKKMAKEQWATPASQPRQMTFQDPRRICRCELRLWGPEGWKHILMCLSLSREQVHL